jgi:glycosyltransferase involved in cell wall biosynthesis
MQEKPILSVIVPVYNSEPYLKNCLDSILAQTFKEIEIIIINDGSTDRSRVICEDYSTKDNRIRILHKENKGVSAARNDGINLATGEFIAFADSDDILMPDMYQLLLHEIMQKNSDSVCCGYSHKNTDYFPLTDFCYNSIAEAVYYLERDELFGLIWNKIYISKIVNDRSIRFPVDCMFGEDMFFNLHYFSTISSICFVSKPLYIYRENPASISKIRPSTEQCLARFNNISSKIIQLREKLNEHYINRLLALDFTYTVFLIRSLYYPKKEIPGKRSKIIETVKIFYNKYPAYRPFRYLRYTLFYYLFITLPFSFFDVFASVFFKNSGENK